MMLVERDAMRRLAQQLREARLALIERLGAQVDAVEIDEIETAHARPMPKPSISPAEARLWR
jgi:hypothetical protein